MTDFSALEVLLYDEPIGVLNQLPGDRTFFSFYQSYIQNPQRPMLSLSFKDVYGDLIETSKPTRTRVPPFFSNLLPEGHMREYLAKQAKVNPQREFYLLSVLGKDLAGALTLRSPTDQNLLVDGKFEKVVSVQSEKSLLRFSLAGIQLKFSAIWEKEGGLTIPVNGVGGSWIVKLPSSSFSGVPENEFVMMELARLLGIDVPTTALIPVEQIHGLPDEVAKIAKDAFVIKRFDRDPHGKKIQIEDFAQVFGVFPEKKYRSASYRNIAEVIGAEVGEEGVVEFVRRFVFNALIGNGDMHLKNWSLIYPDKRQAKLAPAYDFVSTIPYLPNDELALTFVDSKDFRSLNTKQFRRFAAQARLPENLVIETMLDTVSAFRTLWKSVDDLRIDSGIKIVISHHLEKIPIWREA